MPYAERAARRFFRGLAAQSRPVLKSPAFACICSIAPGSVRYYITAMTHEPLDRQRVIRLSTALDARIERIADEHDRSFAYVARRLLERATDRTVHAIHGPQEKQHDTHRTQTGPPCSAPSLTAANRPEPSREF